MTMLLAIDVGNTNSVFAVFDGDRLCGKWRLSTNANRTPDEYAVTLQAMMLLKNLNFSDIKAVMISSVVPQTHFALKTLCKEYIGCKLNVVNADTLLQFNMQVKTDLPQEVGADRLVNAVAAFTKYQQASIILDFGTATTFDVVDSDGAYLGGMIAPGIQLSLDALHRAAAKLPEIGVERPKQVIGTSTVTAMQAGIYYGYIGLIEGIVKSIQQEMKNNAMIVIATGGFAPLFANATTAITHVDADLTLDGLREIYKRNQLLGKS